MIIAINVNGVVNPTISIGKQEIQLYLINP